MSTDRNPMRRPRDLKREIPGSRSADGRALGWPSGFASAAEDRRALAVLMSLASLTPRRLLELAAAEGTAGACLAAVQRGSCASIRDTERARDLSGLDVLASASAAGARLVTVDDPAYPMELSDLFDPPAGLFVRGEDVVAGVPRVAIVGARTCSAGGREVAAALAGALAGAGASVVSGAARGIDAAAHQGALSAGGRTVAVLGSGIDVAYPRQNRRLIEEIADRGTVLSEYPPAVRAEPFRFPARNRLVAALSMALVVVEGASGSGSLITADHALDVGREVLAVPGAVTSELAEAPLTLIREGATLIRGPDDLLHDLGLLAGASVSGAARSGAAEKAEGGVAVAGLTGMQRTLWMALIAPSTPDALAGRAGVALPEVMSALAALELRRLVRSVGGRYERRAAR